MMETTMPLVHIADEIVDEILTRLPVKSLLRFKCVCKRWLSTISNPNFHKKREFESIVFFNSKTRNVSLHSIDNDKVTTESSFVLGTQSKYEGKKTVVSNSCNGLVIIGFEESFFLFNPLTRYFVRVLKLNCMRHNSVVVAGLCYDESSNDYKVVIRFTRHLDDQKYVVVARLKTKWWVEINFPFVAASTKAGPIVNGRMHWTVNDATKIICFDPRKNLFEDFPSPPSKFQNATADIIGLGVVGDRLCMVRRVRQTSQVLIMKEYGIGESWTALTVMTLFFPPFLFIKNGENHEILGNKNTSQILAYNPKENIKRKFDLPNPNLFGGISFVQNLTSPVGIEWDRIRHKNYGSTVKWVEDNFVYSFG
ncbi:hypothetical protein LguiB_026234 [Lonicera macranthoides]